MNIRIALLGATAMMVTACATAPTVPSKRPMTVEAKTKMGSPDVHVLSNDLGIGASWFQQQSNGGGAGLAGVLGAAIADGIMNAAPSSRASKAANEVAEKIVADDLNASFIEALKTAKMNDGGEMIVQSVSLVNGSDKSLDYDGKVAVSVSYVLAEDASAFRATANAQYENADIPYVTPYTFEKKVPKSQLGGPVYRNQFVFNSKQFEAPILTEDLKVELVKSVENSFRGEDGMLPTEGADFKKMQKRIEKAQDDKLKKSEISVFLVQRWLENDAADMKSEISEAHRFIAKYLLTDLKSTDVPTLSGSDDIVETTDSGRVVKLVGEGMSAGSYVSEPGNLYSFTTYGNAVNYSKVGKDQSKQSKKDAKSSN